MKRILDFFTKLENNEGKVTERMLTKAIVTSAIGILVCMSCLVGVTWAWSTRAIGTEANKIEGACFDVNVTVTETVTGTGTEQAVALNPDENGVYNFPVGTSAGETTTEKTYTVKIKQKDAAKAAGFCHISLTPPGDGMASTTYYTAAMSPSASEYKFSITGFASMKITPMMGASNLASGDPSIIASDGEKKFVPSTGLATVPAPVATQAIPQTTDSAQQTQSTDNQPGQQTQVDEEIQYIVDGGDSKEGSNEVTDNAGTTSTGE